MADEPSGSAHIQDFILSRELAEVYLLLDNLSSAQTKTIPSVPKDDPLFGGGGNAWNAADVLLLTRELTKFRIWLSKKTVGAKLLTAIK